MKQTNKWFALALILTAPLLTIVDVYIINMAIPAIKKQYQTVDSLTELVISAYLVGYCVFLITGSRMGDYYGRKKIFLWGMLGFTLTSALFCLSFRVMLCERYPPQYAALAAGVYSTVQQFSSAFGLSIIGSIYFYSLHAGLDGYKVGMTCVLLYLISVIVLLYRLSTFTDVNVVVKPVVNE